MRYFFDNTTLLICGSFRAAGPGTRGGVRTLSTLLNRALPLNSDQASAEKELELAAAGAGVGWDYAGFVTQVPIPDLCVLQYDFLTVFITAAHPGGTTRNLQAGAIAVIICSSQGMSDAALLETVGTAGDSVAEALSTGGLKLAGTTTDSIIVASEGAPEHSGAGQESPVGARVRAALLKGIPEALKRSGGRRSGEQAQKRPAFFVYSRFRGEHWVEWTPEGCPYYPCHFEGQRCDFCYCPFYPCGNEALGQWSENANHGRVWNCAACTMIHEPGVAEYLKKYPGASMKELLRVRKTGSVRSQS